MSIKNQFEIGNGNSIGYCTVSETIRQYPQNYILAKNVGGLWLCDCDGAVDVKTGLMIQLSLMCDNGKFMRGEQLALYIEANHRIYNIEVSENK